MWNWFNLSALFGSVQSLKDELAAAQAKVTELTNGALTLESELAILRYALLIAGIKIPATLPPPEVQAVTIATAQELKKSVGSPYDAGIKRL